MFIHHRVLLLWREAKSSVVIPPCVREIGGEAFLDCKGLTHVVIPEGVKVIYRNAFANCSNLVSVVLPESLEKIEYRAFAGCVNLEKMNFPAGLNIIGYNAFEGCDKLQNAPDATEEDPYRDIRLIHLEFLRDASGIDDEEDLMHKDPVAFVKKAFIRLGIDPRML